MNFWCYSIGVADDGAGKLAAQAVNTTTTLLTVALGLLAANGAQKYPGIPWERIQTKIITALLPLVICGYIAALFKEAQIYWRNTEKKSRNNGSFSHFKTERIL